MAQAVLRISYKLEITAVHTTEHCQAPPQMIDSYELTESTNNPVRQALLLSTMYRGNAGKEKCNDLPKVTWPGSGSIQQKSLNLPCIRE